MEPDVVTRLPPSLAAEHDWGAASRVIHPSFRPVGTAGMDGRDPKIGTNRSPGLPLVMTGLGNLPIVFVLPADGFGVLVGAEHMLGWNVGPDDIYAAAMANLASWSSTAGWSEDADGGRRVIWSDWGQGMDATRILLPEVRAQLTAQLSPQGRVLVGMPESSLLIATSLAESDQAFAGMFATYVADRWSEATEPIDGRIFELLGDRLEEFAVPAQA